MDILLTALAVQLVNLSLFAYFKRTALLRELALRHQLRVYKRKDPRPTIKNRDRLLWAILARLWRGWKEVLVIVNPKTVIGWQKRRIRDFLRRQSRRPGRPRIPREHIAFIRRISTDHPEYGAARIALELKLKFGVEHAESTVDRYRVKAPRDPDGSQKWRTFIQNNAQGLWACDFVTEYTVGLRALHLFIIMHLETRKVVHFAVTEHPTLDWVRQQFRNATFENEPPKFLIHDNDGRFGQFGKSVPVLNEDRAKKHSCRSALDAWLWKTMDVRSVPTPFGAPNANAHLERLNGTLRRECLDHVLVWSRRHLLQTLTVFFRWYNGARVHQGLQGIPDPDPALLEPRPAAAEGHLVAYPVLGGLHHDYRLAA